MYFLVEILNSIFSFFDNLWRKALRHYRSLLVLALNFTNFSLIPLDIHLSHIFIFFLIFEIFPHLAYDLCCLNHVQTLLLHDNGRLLLHEKHIGTQGLFWTLWWLHEFLWRLREEVRGWELDVQLRVFRI